ncbi:MAG: hypothetical protein RMK52_03940 [Chitinophagales bacterium]|nr:hypothetical protein [Chitinophagales bacterium]MDW8393379.1 hypothetical protein [Chitinophagales bacterium]
MLKDITFLRVEDVAVAIVPDNAQDADEGDWRVYLINLKPDAIDSVLITSKGYGTVNGKSVSTTTLRQYIRRIEGMQVVGIELLRRNVCPLNNEFWISFWHQGALYDKKYVFVTNSLVPDNFTLIPLLNQRGVMIR